MKKITVLMPVYNEYSTLLEILKRVEDADFCGLEKEIILILVSETDKEKIMKAIASEYGISSEANSVTFAVPVDESVGVNV